MHAATPPVRRSDRVIPLRTRIAALPNLVPLPTRFDPERAVVLAGSSRSGTTWLGQVMGQARDYALINEPFNPKMPGIAQAGFTWRTWIHPECDWPAGERAVARVLRGDGVSLKLLLRNGMEAFGATGLVIKEVRINRLLPWLLARFRIRGAVLLIRHPCAVVSSQIRHFRFKDLTARDDLEYLEQNLPALLPMASRLKTEEERRALAWALDQRVPLATAMDRSFTLVSYERLVLEGDTELDRIFSSQRLTVPEQARRQLGLNSWQARDGSVDHETAPPARRLDIWRDRLDRSAVHRILDVVHACGITGFTDNALPDFDGIGVDDAPARSRREAGSTGGAP